MNLSATQLETAEMCGRKWWFRYHARLPEIKKDTTSFGSVLHAVCERYLKGAEESDLYPQRWDFCPDTKKQIDPVDAALIQVLVSMAIKEGILERRPGGEVERDFQLACGDNLIRGKIDYVVGPRIEDHKNSKSERYFKSAQALRSNLQMMLYAKHVLEREFRAKGAVPPKFLTLVHNQYLRNADKPMVRRREAEVTPSEVDDFWETRIRPLIAKCEELSRIASPFHIPDPDKSACEAYGGCTYASICHGGEDQLTYKNRVDSFSSPQQPQQPQFPIMMNPQDFLARRAGNVAAPVNPPTTTTQQPAAPTPPPATASSAEPTPPWFDPNCPVCKLKARNKGFREDGRPCKICLVKNKGGADGFTFSTQPDGRITWQSASAAGSTQVVQPATVAPARTAYGVQELLPRLKAMGSAEGVMTLLGEAEGVLGAGTAEYSTFAAAAQLRLDEIDAAEQPPAKVTDPTPTTVVPLVTNPPPPVNVVTPPTATALRSAVAGVPVTVVSDSAMPVQQTLPTLPEPTPEPAKRPRGRPKGSTNKPAAEERKEEGFLLLVGAMPLSAGGREIVAAEEILNSIEGYWAAEDVWKRRGEVRNRFRLPEILATLAGTIVVQTMDDPDIENLVSTLIPHADLVVRGVL